MDRKEFLKGCATGLCACATACLPKAAVAADAPKPEDWRIPFVKQRYAKLLNSLSQKMDKTALAGALQDVGDFCASQSEERAKKFQGDIEGYCKSFKDGAQKDSTMNITYDKARNVVTSIYSPGGDCVCPFNSLASKTPGVECECSVGWVRHTFGIVLGKTPKVELKEAVLRGGKVCRFEITAA
jgi:hypothetical protein